MNASQMQMLMSCVHLNLLLTQQRGTLYRLWYGRMVKALAWRVEGPGFKSHHGKSFGKKRPAILCLHDGSLDDGSAPQLIKRLGCVLSCLYD